MLRNQHWNFEIILTDATSDYNNILRNVKIKLTMVDKHVWSISHH